MRLLLDTSIVIWSADSPGRLAGIRSTLDARTNDVIISAVVVWEIAIKHALGRLSLPVPPASFVPEIATDLQATALPITHEHALGVAELPPIHGDPFDRLLVSQAQRLGATLVTADAVFARYDVETLLA